MTNGLPFRPAVAVIIASVNLRFPIRRLGTRFNRKSRNRKSTNRASSLRNLGGN
jgi:hypothetical protein